MILLAFDTSSRGLSVGLLLDKSFTLFHEIAPMQQAKRILYLIDKCLSENNLSINQIDAIAFGRGPGSFTGVRIAISVAQGLGFAAQKPLIPISTLQATALAAYQNLNWKRMVVAEDARMNEVYWAAYEVISHNEVKLIGQENLTPADKMKLPDSTFAGVGGAWDVYQTSIGIKPALLHTNDLSLAKALLVLGENKFNSGEIVKPIDALPHYLRDNVAQKSNLV